MGRQEAQAPSQQETKKAADAVTMSCDIDECIHTELQDRLRCIEPMLIKRIRDAYGVDAPSIPHSERLRRNVAEHAAFGSTISDMSPIMLRRAQKGGLAVPPLLLSVKSALDKVTLRVDDIDAKLSISVPKASIGVGTHEPITATCFSLDDFQTEGDDGWPLPPECHPTTDEGEDGCPLPCEWKDKGEISGCPLPSEWKDEDKDEDEDDADDDGGCPLPSEWKNKDGEDGCPFHTELKDKDGEDDGCPLPPEWKEELEGEDGREKAATPDVGWLGAEAVSSWADETDDTGDQGTENVEDYGVVLYPYVPPSQAELAHNAALMAQARRICGKHA